MRNIAWVGLLVLFSSGLGCETGRAPDGGTGSLGGDGGAASGGGGGACSGAECAEDGCAGLSEAECRARPECGELRAYAAGAETPAYVDCAFFGVGLDRRLCGGGLTCARPTSGEGECLTFTMDCLPADWTRVECASVDRCEESKGGLGGAGGA
jgi:hypothetical protein